MLNYGFWPRHLIIMLNYEKEIGVINDDLGWNLCNLRNPQKWHNFPPKFFMYRKRARVQALPWFEICAQGTCRKLLKGGPVLRSFSLFGNSDRLAGTFRWSEDRRTAWRGTFHPLAQNRILQVMELKIQRKNLGSALRHVQGSKS
jgi:hypothetical protein